MYYNNNYSQLLVLCHGNRSDGNVRKNPKAGDRLVSRGALDAVGPKVQRGLPVPPPLPRVVSQDGDTMQLDGGVGRLVVEGEEEDLTAMETHGQQVLLEVNGCDLELVVVTSRVPESHLSGGGRGGGGRGEGV